MMGSTGNGGDFFTRAAAFAAFGAPALLGVMFAAPEPYWLDAPEFTAAAQTLGMPHPPGHPLYVMLVKPFTLIPLGSIAFRVSWASAMFGAFASLLLYHITYRLLRSCVGSLAGWFLAVCSLSVSLIASVAPGWWFQCVRQEVYSLQILLVLGFLYPFVRFCLKPVLANDRFLLTAAFVFGVGLTNHHFIMFAALPALMWVIVAIARNRSVADVLKLAFKIAALACFGLLPYLFLPLRAASGAAVSLGGVHSLSDFIWVVTAKVYQKSMTRQFEEGLDERTLDSLFSMMGQIGPVIVTASFVGFYMLIRNRRTRLTGTAMAILVGVNFVLRATMGFDPFNPDYYGYMLPVVAGLAVGFGVFIAVTVHVLDANLRIPRAVPVIVAASMIAIPLLRARTAKNEIDLSSFRATRLLCDFCFDNAAPGSLVLATHYNLFFALSSGRYVDGGRPDIVTVNPMLLSYPGYLDSTLRAHPFLVPLARTMLVHGKLTESETAALALNQPVRIEPDVLIDGDVARYMVPDAPVYHTAPEPLARSDVEAAAPDYLNHGWQRLYRLIGPDVAEHETWRMLSWCHFKDAIFFARRGDHDHAIQAVRMAQALGNKAKELERLGRALAPGGDEPMDVTPFLPGGARGDGP